MWRVVSREGEIHTDRVFVADGSAILFSLPVCLFSLRGFRWGEWSRALNEYKKALGLVSSCFPFLVVKLSISPLLDLSAL